MSFVAFRENQVAKSLKRFLKKTIIFVLSLRAKIDRIDMQKEQPICKISGSETVEHIKKRMWRIQLNLATLEKVQKTIARINLELSKPEGQRDYEIIEAFTCYAVIEYTKCFNSDISDKLNDSIFSDFLPPEASPNDLSEREFHNLIMNYRNQHLAHSGKLLKVADAGGIKLPNGNFVVSAVVATRSYQEESAFYNGLNALTSKAHLESNRRLSDASKKLIEKINEGEASITNEPIQLVPISDQITPREMWDLPQRSR